MKTSLGQLSLKYIGPKIWSNIPENLKSSSPHSFGKKYKKVLLSCQASCWSSLYMLVTFCNIALMPLFSLLSTSIITDPTPVHKHAFPHCCLLLFYAYFTWRWFDAFITFITSCKTSSIKMWFVLAAGLAENLTQVVFRQPFVIQHVRTRFLNCEAWNFLFFIFFHHHVINDVKWCYSLRLLYFLLLHSCYFVIWVAKMHDFKPYHTYSVYVCNCDMQIFCNLVTSHCYDLVASWQAFFCLQCCLKWEQGVFARVLVTISQPTITKGFVWILQDITQCYPGFRLIFFV